MVSRAFFVPGTVLLFLAFILSVIVSVSLPSLPALDIARIHFVAGNLASSGSKNADTVRFGIWGFCVYDIEGDRTCIDLGNGYTVEITSHTVEITSFSNTVTIGPGATRGLVVHPVATGVTFIALLSSLSSHVMLVLLAMLLSFLAAFLTLIALAIDISLCVILRNGADSLGDDTFAGPGTWITLVTLILLLMAGAIGWIGRRRSRMAGATDNVAADKP